MKVIILVQSIDKPDYIKLREAQQSTWDSITYPNVETIYYKPDGQHENLVGNILNTPENWSWVDMYKSFAKALRLLLKQDWDYIFKTDNSTYIDKEVLYNLLLTKPRTEYFGGMLYPYSLDNKFVWGDGYAISRDLAKYIVTEFNKAPFFISGVDDEGVSTVLKDKAILDNTLKVYEVKSTDKIELGHHLYRVRMSDTGLSPAVQQPDNLSSIIDEDIKQMYNIHNLITNG